MTKPSIYKNVAFVYQDLIASEGCFHSLETIQIVRSRASGAAGFFFLKINRLLVMGTGFYLAGRPFNYRLNGNKIMMLPICFSINTVKNTVTFFLLFL